MKTKQESVSENSHTKFMTGEGANNSLVKITSKIVITLPVAAQYLA